MARLFIGGLKEGASRSVIEREFASFGPLKEVWIARKPPGFGFILFEEVCDADDALKEMDGQYVCGSKIRVEYAKGGNAVGSSRGDIHRGRRNDEQCYNCGRYGHSGRDCRKEPLESKNGRRYKSRSRSRSRSYEKERRYSSRKYPRRRSSHSRSRSRERKSHL